MKKISLVISYLVVENYGAEMDSKQLVSKQYKASLSGSEELLTFLKSLDDVEVNDEILKKVQEDGSVFSSNTEKQYSHAEAHYMSYDSTVFTLSVKSVEI